MDAIETLRMELDAVDEQIISLIAKRMAIARGIGRCKEVTKMPVHDGAREQAVGAHWTDAAKKHGLDKDEMEKILAIILGMSRSVQRERQ